jgi:hypothetical protein
MKHQSNSLITQNLGDPNSSYNEKPRSVGQYEIDARHAIVGLEPFASDRLLDKLNALGREVKGNSPSVDRLLAAARHHSAE